MFSTDNIIIAFAIVGFTGILGITIYLTNQQKKVNNIMKLNKGVKPLLLQQSTQRKYDAIRAKLPNNPGPQQQKIKANLDLLVTQYRSEAIGIQTYNQGLDKLMRQLQKK
jgi:hypothetical protein